MDSRVTRVVRRLLAGDGLAPPLPDEDAGPLANALGRLCELDVYARSIAAAGHTLFFLGRRGIDKRLCLLGPNERADCVGDAHRIEVDGEALILNVCPLNHENAASLRRLLPFTAPQTLGLKRSAGFGDRLGLATPGHLRAARRHTLAPILAQQSIREMTRTDRTPEQVMDDATWGVFEEGWRDGFGADADHLKTTEDVDRCVAAGFTFYTIDPSAFVDNQADTDGLDTLREKVKGLDWDTLETNLDSRRSHYVGRSFEMGRWTVDFDEPTLLRALVKYGNAVAHTARLYRYLAGKMAGRPFELEMSVDETETPTTVQEHFFVASELKRLNVEWISLAPRFVGRMEKGVDYIGDLAAFEQELVKHVAIARLLGPYKLSLHSGSDKFSIYPIFARLAGELFHLKTAGTSYLEALRALARIEPDLFREILAFSIERYDEDRATYHVSADPSRVPDPYALQVDALPSVLDQFDARQVLHVAFGSVLTVSDGSDSSRFRERITQALRTEEEVHYGALEAHFERHLAPFD